MNADKRGLRLVFVRVRFFCLTLFSSSLIMFAVERLFNCIVSLRVGDCFVAILRLRS